MPYRAAPRPGPALRTIALVEGEVVGLEDALRQRGVRVMGVKAGRLDVDVRGEAHRIVVRDGRLEVRRQLSLWKKLLGARTPQVSVELLTAIHAALEVCDDCRLVGWTTERFAVPASAPDAPVGPQRTWATFRSEDFPIERFEHEESGGFISYDSVLGAHVARAVRSALEARGSEVGPVEHEEWSCWFRCVIADVRQTVCVCTLGTSEYEEPEAPEYSVALCGPNPFMGGSSMAAREVHAVLLELAVEELRWMDHDAEHEAATP